MICKKHLRTPIMVIALISMTNCQATEGTSHTTNVSLERKNQQNTDLTTFPEKIVPLMIDGENFVDPTGKRVRFWGVNLTAFYPTHLIAEKTAENLASLGINLVRPHHMMRPSRDWNPHMLSGALVDYKHDSRHFDKNALDKFDYLNAKLRQKGIYLALALRWSRMYRSGDVNIIKTTQKDASAWTAAWEKIQSWNWKKQLDIVKSLSLIDERFMAIDEEFARNLLSHINPYTRLSYAKDPQVATIEIVNEYGAEYTFICNNKFPPYFHKKLQNKWDDFSRKNNVESSNFYSPKTQKQRILRLDFMVSLDRARMKRMTNIVRSLGFKGAITYSNLFRGENLLSMQEKLADYTEDHTYADPFVVNKKDDFFYTKSKSLLKNKPFILSEFNITENTELRDKRKNKRTMLIAASTAYGSLSNWSGITWFSWQHGNKQIGRNGWSLHPGRDSTIGNLAKDEMQLDHFRTAATIFRNGYIQSAPAKIMHVDSPYKYDEYNQLIAGKYHFQKGWQDVYPIRKTYSPAIPSILKSQRISEWMTKSPTSPLISETKQIIKDINRKQLTASSEKAEIFSGYLDHQKPKGIRFMNLHKNQGFATVMLTSNDSKALINSNSLLISKTFFENTSSWFGIIHKEKESDNLSIRLNTNQPYSKWEMKITRPINHKKKLTIKANKHGVLKLPTTTWHEAVINKISDYH